MESNLEAHNSSLTTPSDKDTDDDDDDGGFTEHVANGTNRQHSFTASQDSQTARNAVQAFGDMQGMFNIYHTMLKH